MWVRRATLRRTSSTDWSVLARTCGHVSGCYADRAEQLEKVGDSRHLG